MEYKGFTYTPVPKTAWDNLSMLEKSEMMKVAVRNGITNLQEIRKKYNEFAEGGDKETPRPVTTGGAGYVPSTPDIDIRQRLYDNITPFGYNNPIERIASAVFLNKPSDKQEYAGNRDILDDLWGTYLSIPKDRRHYDPVLKTSKYKPTNSKGSNQDYVSIPFANDDIDHIIKEALWQGERSQVLNPELGTFTVDIGRDKKGQYVSYYDRWDLNPFRGITNVGNKVTKFLGLDKVGDLSFGMGKPIEIYDRIYLDDYYGIPKEYRGSSFLPEVVVEGRKKAEGGGIHIKPENRGKFTALKERTGHSATWFKEHGTPAQKKMATFALNARKWKHEDGGNLFYPGGEITYGQPYYSYDENGKKIDDTLNYNATLPEIIITPDSKKSPAERAVLERERRRNHDAYYGRGTYNTKVDREQTELEKIASQKAWENSIEKRALDYAQAAASGIGVGADILSGLPIYSSLKGARVLSEAETPMDYAEGALWLAPIAGVAGREAWNTGKQVAGKVAEAARPIIENEGVAVVNPFTGDINWIGKGLGSYIEVSPTADGWLGVDYINSTRSGTGRKLYDAAIEEAHKRGLKGVKSGESLHSAPKTYNIWKHYPDKVHLGDYGSHGNSSMIDAAITTKVNSPEELVEATKQGINAAVMKKAPVYGLTSPSNDIPLLSITSKSKNPSILDFGSVEDGTFRFTGYEEDPIQMHLKRAQAKGYDTSGVDVVDISKDSPDRQKLLSILSNENRTEEDVLKQLTQHLKANGNAGNIKGTGIIVYDSSAPGASARVSHEIDHALHFPDEPVPDGVFYPRVTNLFGDLFTKYNNTEVAARGSQIHDYFGHTGNEPITEEMLRYAREHYGKDTGLDNSMSELLWSTKDLKGLADWMTKYATGIVPLGIVGTTAAKSNK